MLCTSAATKEALASLRPESSLDATSSRLPVPLGGGFVGFSVFVGYLQLVKYLPVYILFAICMYVMNDVMSCAVL